VEPLNSARQANGLLIIIDFDRPGDGLIRVTTVSIENTIADMEADY
jgi:hypothetical protein